MPRFINSDTRKIAVLATPPADPDAPTDDELNAGVDITCAVVAGYTLGPTASDAISEPSVCDTANSSTPGRDNYSCDMTLFRPTGASTDVYDDAQAALEGKGSEVWIYERISDTKGAADAFAAADVVSGFKFVLDNQLSVPGDNGYEKFQVQPMQGGRMAQNVAVVAGP